MQCTTAPGTGAVGKGPVVGPCCPGGAARGPRPAACLPILARALWGCRPRAASDRVLLRGPAQRTMPPSNAIAKKAAPSLKKKSPLKEGHIKKAHSKKAPAPYVVFCKETRPKIVKANPTSTFGEVGKALGAKWAKTSDADKKKFA